MEVVDRIKEFERRLYAGDVGDEDRRKLPIEVTFSLTQDETPLLLNAHIKNLSDQHINWVCVTAGRFVAKTGLLDEKEVEKFYGGTGRIDSYGNFSYCPPYSHKKSFRKFVTKGNWEQLLQQSGVNKAEYPYHQKFIVQNLAPNEETTVHRAYLLNSFLTSVDPFALKNLRCPSVFHHYEEANFIRYQRLRVDRIYGELAAGKNFVNEFVDDRLKEEKVLAKSGWISLDKRVRAPREISLDHYYPINSYTYNPDFNPGLVAGIMAFMALLGGAVGWYLDVSNSSQPAAEKQPLQQSARQNGPSVHLKYSQQPVQGTQTPGRMEFFPSITRQTRKALLTKDVVATLTTRGNTYHEVYYERRLPKGTEVEIKGYGKSKYYYDPQTGMRDEAYVTVRAEVETTVDGKLVKEMRVFDLREGIMVDFLTPAPGSPTNNKPKQRSSLLREQRHYAQQLQGRGPQKPDRNRMMACVQGVGRTGPQAKRG
jgi:hypothetical protein